MKKLLTEWRKYLLSEGMKTIKDLPEGSNILVSIGQDIQLAYRHEGQTLYHANAGDPPPPDDAPWGSMTSIKLKKPCLDGYQVVQASARKGWGPLLYDIMLELTSELGGGLTADRGSVSRDAYQVWDYYMRKRKDVEAAELDITNRGYEKITPDDESDDCEQSSSIRWARKNNLDKEYGWSSQPTAYLYSKSSTPTLDALRAAGKLEE